jgi:hypothetical protein
MSSPLRFYFTRTTALAATPFGGCAKESHKEHSEILTEEAQGEPDAITAGCTP